jgi:hypothetical protein
MLCERDTVTDVDCRLYNFYEHVITQQLISAIIIQLGSENQTVQYSSHLNTRLFQVRFWDGRYDSKTRQICPVLEWSGHFINTKENIYVKNSLG